MLSYYRILSNLNQLALSANKLIKQKDVLSTEEFKIVLNDFESSVKRINDSLIGEFGEDPRFARVMAELKLNIDTLRNDGGDAGETISSLHVRDQ